jgi:hypothetical protein
MTIDSAGISGTGNITDGGQFKREKDIYHHGLRPIPIICRLPHPSYFSLVTTI